MIDTRAEGGAYHRVWVNAAEWSKHNTDYKAGEAAYDVALEALRQGTAPFPVVYVTSDRRVVYFPDPDVAVATIPAPSSPVVSDSGEEFIDFLERISGAEIRVVATLPPEKTVTDAIPNFRAETLKTWSPLNFRARFADGHEEWVGWGWRGYVLTWDGRDKNALRIGGGNG